MSQFALEITDLKKTYDSDVVALKGINLAVKEGDFFALLGPNGAGKSSTIGIIASLVTKSAGKVKIFDIDTDENFPEAKRLLGVVSQEINFNNFEKVIDIVTTQAGFYGISLKDSKLKAETTLKRLGLWEKRNEQARTLSGGFKRRLMIAKALIHEPKLLILDEPTAGVDIELRREMWEFLKEINAKGTPIILTTHYLEEAEQLCKNIAIIDYGELVENTTMPEQPEFQDFGEIVLKSGNGHGYIRVDWFTPKGLPTWGDGRLFLQGTDGQIELRKYTDIGRPHVTNTLFLVNDDKNEMIPCEDAGLPYFPRLIADVQERTETAVRQSHTYTTTELSIRAQMIAEGITE